MHSEGQLFAGRFARQPEATWHGGATRASSAWNLSDPAFGAVCAFSFLGLSISLALLDDSSKNEAVILELLNAEVALLAVAAWLSTSIAVCIASEIKRACHIVEIEMWNCGSHHSISSAAAPLGSGAACPQSLCGRTDTDSESFFTSLPDRVTPCGSAAVSSPIWTQQ
jgi:hypothetical protein